MGWDFSKQSKAELVAELTKEYNRVDATGTSVNNRALAHKLVGNQLWAVFSETKNGKAKRTIALFLIEKRGGSVGYKGMTEAMHPYYYNCPLEYLDMAPVACEEWRAKVREYHAYKPIPQILVNSKDGNGKVDLVEAFKKAKEAGLAADPGEGNDGGTCNFDSPAIKLKGVGEAKIQKAAELAGVSASPFKWFGGKRWHWITGFLNGQANRRTRMAEAANKCLESSGLDACCYMQAD